MYKRQELTLWEIDEAADGHVDASIGVVRPAFAEAYQADRVRRAASCNAQNKARDGRAGGTTCRDATAGRVAIRVGRSRRLPQDFIPSNWVDEQLDEGQVGLEQETCGMRI